MVRLNCKSSDLAIVANAELSRNLGQIVEVLGPHTGKPFCFLGHGHVWRVRAVSGRATLINLFGDTGRVVDSVTGPVPDSRLRPVSGPSLGEAEQEARPLKRPVSRRKTHARPAVALQVEGCR